MKGVFKCLLFLGIIGLGVFLYFTFTEVKEKKEEENIKSGWYIEIIYDKPINVREEASAEAKSLGKVNKGEIYKVLDIDTESSKVYYWYKIEYKGKEGFVASGRKKFWVKDYNNPKDIMTPQITFESNEYYVRTIDDINYKHLTVYEDSTDYNISHIVYYEKEKDQYWILYTITDKSGKSSSKMQKIIFEIDPDEDRVVDFREYKR